MTNPHPRPTTWAGLADTLEASGRQMADAFAEMAFQLGAQTALAALLRGEPDDQARTRLTRLTNDQLERLSTGARTLTSTTDGILEDRAATQQSTQATKQPYPLSYAFPADPPNPTITTIRDALGTTWHRDAQHPTHWWCDNDTSVDWHRLLRSQGPLTEIPETSTGRPSGVRDIGEAR